MTLTIFTPTYNRGYILPELYKSLCNQTSQCFKWLIVDDGSSDNTRELVKSWITENKISITYIYQKNQGKMQAHNTGVLSCDTDLFLCVDSDDYITSNTVNDILTAYPTLPDNIAGIISYRGKSTTKVIGTEFPDNLKISTLGHLYQLGFKGDTTLTFKTEILKKFLFPKFPNEKFLTEAFVYNQIDIIYAYFLLRKIHIVCNYRSDGYTQNALKLQIENPIGYLEYYKQCASLETQLKKKIYYQVQCISFALFDKQRIKLVDLKSVILFFPLAVALKIRRIVKFVYLNI